MASIEEMKKIMVPAYQKKYDALEKIAFDLYKLKEEELWEAVVKKMAGLKLLIDHCKGEK